MRWRVGDGSNIMLFEDSWVIGMHGGKLVGKNGYHRPNETVKELIAPTGGWDEALVNQRFMTHEVTSILQNPIGEGGARDERWWILEPHGSFTVKSAYLSQCDQQGHQGATSSVDRSWWHKHVWSMNMPPKGKVFLWRAMNDLLPTKANLKEHHVQVEGHCPLCRDRWATTEHCLFYCPQIKVFWKHSRFWGTMKKGLLTRMQVMAETVRTQHGRNDYNLWYTMTWQLWIYICSRLHDTERRNQLPKEDGCELLRDTYERHGPIFRELSY